jgi:hypothetical protein
VVHISLALSSISRPFSMASCLMNAVIFLSSYILSISVAGAVSSGRVGMALPATPGGSSISKTPRGGWLPWEQFELTWSSDKACDMMGNCFGGEILE